MKRIRSHVFRGRRWKIEYSRMRNADGLCDPPNLPEKTLTLRSGLTGRDAVEVAIHEGLHACLWDLDETTVEETARDITALLVRIGLV